MTSVEMQSTYVHDTDMGKRKSRRKPMTKAKTIQPLETQFNCPFCNHERTCEVRM